MVEFRDPELKDREWVIKCLSHAHSMNCEYTFGNIFVWKTAYTTKIAKFEDYLLIRYGRNENIFYSPPVGTGDFKKACLAIFEDAKANGVKPSFAGVTVSYKDLLEMNFPSKLKFEYNEGYNDYIYETEKMASLSGKKYHGKRNHITNFKNTHDNWAFEKICDDNIEECVNLHTSWIDNKDEEVSSEYSLEFEAVLTALENYKELELVGGILRVDNKAIAYTIGEKQSDDCFVTHFEKAPAEIRGAFALINQEFTKNCLMNYKYVNREEDLGIEGLRRAKRSYYPEIFLEKCSVTYEG